MLHDILQSSARILDIFGVQRNREFEVDSHKRSGSLSHTVFDEDCLQWEHDPSKSNPSKTEEGLEGGSGSCQPGRFVLSLT